MSHEVSQLDLALWVIRLSSDDAEALALAQAEFAQWQQLHQQEAQWVEQMMQFSAQMQQDSSRHLLDAKVLQQSLSAQHEALVVVKKKWDSFN